MKKLFDLSKFFAAIVCFALLLTASVLPQRASAEVEKELIKLQNDWATARIKPDVAFLERLYAKEFRITALGGSVVERAADIAAFASGDMKPEIVRDEEMNVAVYGETAIVTGIEYVKGTYKNNPGEFWLRFTNIYVRRGGQWQMVSHHSTEIRSKMKKINQSKKETVSRETPQYPTMLDITFPEFEAAVKKTDAMLLPVGAIEAHGAHLPLGSDASGATAQVFYVQKYLRDAGFETIIGAPLNIGITNEGDDFRRDGTYIYPGSLNVASETFVALYLDVLRSLRDNGLRRVFLYSNHLGGRHLRAMAQVVEEANKKLEGIEVYALIDSERLERLELKSKTNVLPIEKGLNFQMLTELLGAGAEPARSTHADGWETSLMLYFYPDAVRPGYEKFPQSTSSRFFEAVTTGERAKNPSAIGGFPFEKASAAVGKKIADYRTARIGDAILRILKTR